MTGAPRSTPSGVVVKYMIAAAVVVVSGYLVWALRSLIVPAFVGGLLAYICRPLVTRLERHRIPRGLAVGLLLLTFGIVAVVSVNRLVAAMPSEIGMLELRVRALYSLNRHYQTVMGLDASTSRGNRLYQDLAGADAGHVRVPVVIGAVRRGIERDHAGLTRTTGRATRRCAGPSQRR